MLNINPLQITSDKMNAEQSLFGLDTLKGNKMNGYTPSVILRFKMEYPIFDLAYKTLVTS